MLLTNITYKINTVLNYLILGEWWEMWGWGDFNGSVFTHIPVKTSNFSLLDPWLPSPSTPLCYKIYNFTQLSENEYIVKEKWAGMPVATLQCLDHGYLQSSSVAQSCLTLCDPINLSTPGLPVHHQLLEFTQTHIHRVSDAIQPSHPLSSSSPPAPNPSQHQSLFQWVNSSHEVAKVLEFQL